jgi:hypothetical protein
MTRVGKLQIGCIISGCVLAYADVLLSAGVQHVLVAIHPQVIQFTIIAMSRWTGWAATMSSIISAGVLAYADVFSTSLPQRNNMCRLRSACVAIDSVRHETDSI